jgi:hypothetical protein
VSGGEGRRLDLDRLVRKGTVLFLATLAGVAAVGAVAGYAAFLAEGVDEPTRQRAHTLLVAVVSGGVSFLLGRGLSKG